MNKTICSNVGDAVAAGELCNHAAKAPFSVRVPLLIVLAVLTGILGAIHAFPVLIDRVVVAMSF